VGKNHAVSVGFAVSVRVARGVGVKSSASDDVGAGEVSVRTPHSTSVPLIVLVQLVSVGPVNGPSSTPAPKDVYPVHVAVVVPCSSHARLAVLGAG
jgi:hypothetical protein